MKGDFRQVVGSGPADGNIDAAAEALTFDVSELEHVIIQLVQVTDAGTVVLVTEASIDGTYWDVVDASTAETDFAAGAGTTVSFSLSDANGMPKAYRQARVRASALAGGGVYTARCSGHATK
jgi:hypothetical protein